MKCPACFNELSETQVGSVVVDVCEGGCGGIWFDAFELDRVDEEHETAGEHLLQIRRDPELRVDDSRKRECPRCTGIKLLRRLLSPRSAVQVDHCPNCAGYWLDAGELQRIREERAAASRQEKIAKESVLSTATIRYLYRMRIETRS